MHWALRSIPLLVLLGCSSGPPSRTDLVDACRSDALDCLDTTVDPACTATWVAAVRGRLVDDVGAPVAGARAQLCARLAPDDRLVCLVPPITEADGTFTIVVGPSVRCMRSATLRYVVTDGGFATTYCPLDPGVVSGGVARLSEDAVVFRVPPSSSLPARGDPAAEREVDLGAVVLDLVPDALGPDASYESLGARAVAPARSCVGALRALDGTIALAPEAALDPAARLRLRLPATVAGDRVEVSVLGGLGTPRADGTTLGEGEVDVVGTGTVGADGVVALATDTPLTYLSWLGWRRIP